MEGGLLKFIVDLGSVGGVVFVVYLAFKFYNEGIQKLTSTLDNIVEHFLNTIEEIKDRHSKEE